MSRREHGILRLGALVVLALCAWLPRGALAGAGAAPPSSTVLSSAPGAGARSQVGHGTYASVATVAFAAPGSR